MTDGTPRFLLVRTDRLGDVVLTLPAVGFLRRRYPRARIGFLTRAYTAPLLAHYRGIDRVFTYRPEGEHRGLHGLKRLAGELARENFDEAVLFRPTAGLAWALWQAGIPTRTGTGYRSYSVLFNRRVYEHRKTGLHHELAYNLNLLAHHGDWRREPIQFDFQFSEALEAWWQNFSRSHGLVERYVLVHPGSGGSSPNLEPAQYRLLVEQLLARTDWPVVLTGLAGEAGLIQSLTRGLPGERLLPLAGRFSLEQLAVCIAHSRLLISGSTGPLHLADALGVPVLSFFCPARPCSPRRWGPYFQQEWAITPDLKPCRSGRPARCPEGNCLARLSGEALAEALKNRLESLPARRAKKLNPTGETSNRGHGC